jgi:outer membrane protein
MKRSPIPACLEARPKTPALASRRGWFLSGPIAILLLLTAFGRPAAATELPSTLIELVRAALATDESISRADSQIRRAQADVRLSSAVLMPRFDINGSYTRYKEEQVLQLSPDESFVIVPSSDWSWNANLKQTLFYGLRDWRARNVTLLNRDIARLERQTAMADLTLAVAHTFFAAVSAEQRLLVVQAAHQQVKEQARVADRRFEVGEVARADVLRWQAELAAQRQAVVIAEGALQLARRRLARLTGVTEIGTLSPPGPVPVPGEDQAQLVARALEQRLEMLTLHHQLEAAGIMVKIEKGAWLPEVEANAGYFRQKAPFPSPDWMSLTLTVSIPVYDGGLTAARVAKAREDLLEVELLASELEKGITDQVESAAITYGTATAVLEAARERENAARSAHFQVERAYRVGEASATDLLTTTTELTDASTAVIIAQAERQLGAIALRHAVGETPIPDLDLGTPDLEPVAE